MMTNVARMCEPCRRAGPKKIKFEIVAQYPNCLRLRPRFG